MHIGSGLHSRLGGWVQRMRAMDAAVAAWSLLAVMLITGLVLGAAVLLDDPHPPAFEPVDVLPLRW